MIFIYITNPDKKMAMKVARILLEKRLVGCVNIFPIESMYWWKKKIEKSKEYVAIAKTSEKNYARVRREVKKIHPYSAPCIVKLKVWPNHEYSEWLKGEIE